MGNRMTIRYDRGPVEELGECDFVAQIGHEGERLESQPIIRIGSACDDGLCRRMPNVRCVSDACQMRVRTRDDALGRRMSNVSGESYLLITPHDHHTCIHTSTVGHASMGEVLKLV